MYKYFLICMLMFSSIIAQLNPSSNFPIVRTNASMDLGELIKSYEPQTFLIDVWLSFGLYGNVDSLTGSSGITFPSSISGALYYGQITSFSFGVDATTVGTFAKDIFIHHNNIVDTMGINYSVAESAVVTLATSPYNVSTSISPTGIEIAWVDSNKSANLITNGYNFNSSGDLAYWAATSEATLSVVSNRLKITDNTTKNWPSARRWITGLIPDSTYYYNSEGYVGTNGNSGVYLASPNNEVIYKDSKLYTNGLHQETFIAQDDSLLISLQMDGFSNTGLYVYHDNISLKQMYKDYTGFEIWGREYIAEVPGTWQWLNESEEANKNNSYNHDIGEGEKWGYKVRYYTDIGGGTKNYTAFSSEDTLTYSITPVSSEFNGTYLTDANSTITFESVETYENIGLYLKASSLPTGLEFSSTLSAVPYYQKVGESTWIQGHELWFDSWDDRVALIGELISPFNNVSYIANYEEANRDQYRGSIVQLESNTVYNIEVRFDADGDGNYNGVNDYAKSITDTTWTDPENLPYTLAEIVIGADTVNYLPVSMNSTLTIEQSGTPNNYIKYMPSPSSSATIDVNNSSNYCIHIKASYIIIEDVTLRDAKISGIYIDTNKTDIIIDGVDISNWGRSYAEAQPSKYIPGYNATLGENTDAGIHINGRTATGTHMGVNSIARVTIQNSIIGAPRWDANSKSELRYEDTNGDDIYTAGVDVTHTHVYGPVGVLFDYTNGNHVFRNNIIRGTDANRNSYCISSRMNNSLWGGINRDSDFYNNEFSYSWGHGIELEGGNMNNRVYLNVFNENPLPIGQGSNSMGPAYIFRNLTKLNRRNASDWDDRDYFVKAGSYDFDLDNDGTDDTWMAGGKAYIYHNTILQPIDATVSPGDEGRTLGGKGLIGSDAGLVVNYVSRNNIVLGVELYDDPTSSNFNYTDYGRQYNAYAPSGRRFLNGDNNYLIWAGAYYTATDRNDFDYDIYRRDVWMFKAADAQTLTTSDWNWNKTTGPIFNYSSHQANGTRLDSNAQVIFTDPDNDDYTLTPSSVGYGTALAIPGFNVGATADYGAFQSNCVWTGASPTNLAADSVGVDSIQITWIDGTGASQVKIFRDSSHVATVSQGVQTYLDAGLDSASYIYWVQSITSTCASSLSNADTQSVYGGSAPPVAAVCYGDTVSGNLFASGYGCFETSVEGWSDTDSDSPQNTTVTQSSDSVASGNYSLKWTNNVITNEYSITVNFESGGYLSAPLTIGNSYTLYFKTNCTLGTGDGRIKMTNVDANRYSSVFSKGWTSESITFTATKTYFTLSSYLFGSDDGDVYIDDMYLIAN